MSKNKKNRRKSKKKAKSAKPLSGKGLDLGNPPAAAAVADIEFQSALVSANILGCAYGLSDVDGLEGPVPTITLVGTDPVQLRKAFDQFKRWGCEEDGDSVNVTLRFKESGEYELWLGPEIERFLHRTLIEPKLFRPFALILNWIKRMDTTNAMVRELAEYCKNEISPVRIDAGVVSKPTVQLKIDDIVPIDDLPRLVKFSLEAYDESEVPERYAFANRAKQARSSKKRAPSPPNSVPKPSEFSSRRNDVIRTAFPVTRERVLRHGFVTDTQSRLGYENVHSSQILQAVINLILSAELFSGELHYHQVTDFSEVWEHVRNRVEEADGSDLPKHINVENIITQIDLDVRSVMNLHGIPLHPKFKGRQALFIRKGFVCD